MLAWLAYLTVAVVWGSTYFAIAFGHTENGLHAYRKIYEFNCDRVKRDNPGIAILCKGRQRAAGA